MSRENTHIGLDPSHITSLVAILRTLLTSARAFLLTFILTGQCKFNKMLDRYAKLETQQRFRLPSSLTRTITQALDVRHVLRASLHNNIELIKAIFR